MSNSDPFKDWYDISSETFREYVTSGGAVYRIDNPQRFLPNKVSGTHYVLDSQGVVHTLLTSAFMVCRFLDRNGVSFTTTRSGDTSGVTDFTTPTGTKMHLIGDPHLGRKFEVGVPLARKGEREKKQLAHFKAELAIEADVIIMVGDLFDHPYVAYAIVQDAADAITEAVLANPDTVYVFMAGNHDLPRNIKNVGAFDDLSDRLSGRYKNCHIVRSPTTVAGVAIFPWEWDRRADEQVSDIRQWREIYAAVGHWDLAAFNGRDDHLAPVEAIREAFGKIPIYSGHFHKPGEYIVNGHTVYCTGSLEPYAHDQDPTGDYYVTLTRSEALGRDDLRNKHVKVILEAGEDVPELDCFALTYSRKPPVNDGATATIDLKSFDWDKILAQKLAPLDPRVSDFIKERLTVESDEPQE